MCLWTLEQGQDFFDASDSSSLFSILSNELNISSEQVKRIQARKYVCPMLHCVLLCSSVAPTNLRAFRKLDRQRVRDLASNLRESLTLLGEVKKLVESRQRNFDRKIGALQAILTPRQVGKFVTWVTRNQQKLAQVIPSFHVPDIFSLGVGGSNAASSSTSAAATSESAPPESSSASTTSSTTDDSSRVTVKTEPTQR
jgi:hypothetical protein